MRQLVAVLCAALALVALPAGAAADQLALAPGSLPGLRAAHASGATARADLAAGLPRNLARDVAAIQTLQVSANAGHGQLVRSDAFVFGSSGAAHAVLAGWRRVHRARHAALGEDGATFSRTRGRSTLVEVAWRERAEVGVVVLRATRSVSDPTGLGFQYARLQDSSLRIAPPATAWDRVSNQIRPDGSVSEQTALQAFALSYGPLPGVRVPRGPLGDSFSGDLADDMILPYLPRLPARQRRVVEKRLGIVPATRGLAHAACILCDYGDPTFKPDAVLQATANVWVADYAAQIGPLGMTVVVGTATTTGPAPYADAQPMLDDSGAYGDVPQLPAICRIRMYPSALAAGADGQGWILAHEVFHCFQYSILGSRAWYARPAPWVMEGLASWAAFVVDPVMYSAAVKKILDYINDPQEELFQRDYDAVGFWLHLQDAAGLFWGQIHAILSGGSSTADFNASGADSSGFFNGWGSSVLRVLAGNSNWYMVAPFALPDFNALEPGGFEVLPGAGTVYAAQYATSQYQIGGADPIVHVVISGHARLSLEHEYTQLSNAWFCRVPGTCTCPPGSTGSIPPTQPLEFDAYLGLAGDPITGTQGTVASYTVEELCHPQPPQPSLQNNAIDNGDPYLTTFDSQSFGFQQAGEFVLVKSKTDDLEVQSRQVPYPGFVFGSSWAHSLAMNTAFAMRDGGATVELDSGAVLRLYVNKHRLSLSSGQRLALAGGGYVRYNPHETLVVWPDGTAASVFTIGLEGVNLMMHPNSARDGHLAGLFGDNAGGDFIGRTGHHYPAKVIEMVSLFGGSRAAEHVAYDEFGRSWRVRQSESLFVYPRGKNTHSYDVPGFPHHLVSLGSFTRAIRAAAAAICRRDGVSNPALLNGCTIDVGATHNHVFASSDGSVQKAVSPGPLPTVDLSGTWSGSYSGVVSGSFTLTWLQSASILQGKIHLSSPDQTLTISGSVHGSAISFGKVGGVQYRGTVSGNSMSGTYQIPNPRGGSAGGGSWSATKTS